MYILYFYSQCHEYYHGTFERNGWLAETNWRPGEGFWLVPGTDPEDPAYWRDYEDQDEDENEGDENDETLEYMCDLLEAHEIEPDEFRRQLRSEGYNDETIRLAIRRICQLA